MNDTAPLTQAPQEQATLLQAPQGSAHAPQIDIVLDVINWVSLISLILITAAMLYFVFKYRRKTEHDETPHISHNLTLEVIWSVIPMVFLFGLFFFGYKTYAEINEPPANVYGAVDIYVTGRKWNWDFVYPQGGKVNSRSSLRNEKNAVLENKFADESKFKASEKVKDFTPGDSVRIYNQTDYTLGQANDWVVSTKEISEKLEGDKKSWLNFPNLEAFKADNKSKSIKPGESVRLTYKIDFTLDAKGEWVKAEAAASKKLDDPKSSDLWVYQKTTDPKANYFVVPVNTPVRLHIKSEDVLHSFAIPSMRVKRDAIPGSQFRSTWFTPVKEGHYLYTCNEMCGTDHSYMIGYMKVVSMADYQKFLKDINVVDPLVAGKDCYKNKCSSCHSLEEGKKIIGPSLFNFFGTKHKTNAGEVAGDDAYMIESIKNPTAKIAEGFPPVMPPIAVSDEEMVYLIQYLKSVK
jgi:heme/copper-type cytochrome/quinol oxidase subunit 2